MAAFYYVNFLFELAYYGTGNARSEVQGRGNNMQGMAEVNNSQGCLFSINGSHKVKKER